jgi:hypothetical protein
MHRRILQMNVLGQWPEGVLVIVMGIVALTLCPLPVGGGNRGERLGKAFYGLCVIPGGGLFQRLRNSARGETWRRRPRWMFPVPLHIRAGADRGQV